MRFVIPLRRAFSEEMAKSFNRAPSGSHKYVRRQRVFSGGRMSWRYFYLDEAQRSGTRQSVDPNEEHEHHLVSDLPKLHENLKNKALKAIDATVDVIRAQFNYKGQVAKTKVTATPTWNEKQHDPFLKGEPENEDGRGMSPQARIAKAVELIPEHLKEMVAHSVKGKDGARGAAGVTALALSTDADEPDMAGIAEAYYRPSSGEIHMLDGAIDSGVGLPEFRSGKLTWTEEVLCHEFGHGVHFSIMAEKPEVWKTWVALHNNPAVERITKNLWGTFEFEDFAETFSCALTYPKQLAKQCPEKYEWMRANVIPELKPLKVILDTPDEELAWWKGKPTTPATRLLNYAKAQKPASRFAPYYSDKDQFYVINKHGRQVYLRVGPTDKESESGWERMPPTIDPVTGLPRYEGGLYNRFRAETLKEIYDEHGKPLDDAQAYLYLGQDDEKVLKDVGKLDDDPVKAVDVWYNPPQKEGATSKAERIGLGRAMFNALGGNLFQWQKVKKLEGKTEEEIQADPELRQFVLGSMEYERRRVAEARAKGDTGVAERHEWVPVEISPREFMEKSGTFKFGEVRSAPADKQTPLRDSKTGKAILRYDPVSGNNVPVVGTRLYEQQNPDGTWTKIRVSEENAFNVGQTIKAPQRFVIVGDKRISADNWATMPEGERKKLEAGGEAKQVRLWANYTLQPGDLVDPEALARKFGTTARSLLSQNQRYGYGQITDPVLSALLNPGGRVQIRDAADLQALMREASESDPPRRTWMSIVGQSTHGIEGQAIAHIQVEWDGAGPPKVVGGYWARKLGKSEIRLDELLNRFDDIKLPRIVEKKGLAKEKVKAYAGSTVWITDPKTGKRIMASFIGPKGDGFAVQPLTGQGAGIAKTMIVVDKYEALTRGEIPDPSKVGRQRRFVEALQHDVLLYADETTPGSGPDDTSGVIRVMLPKDGSVTIDQIRGIDGIQVDYRRDPDQVMNDDAKKIASTFKMEGNVPGWPVAAIAVKDLPKVRDKLGGFVMDSRVRAMLDQAMKQDRDLRERVDSKEVLSTEDIVLPDGTINPNGVCRGLVLGRDGIVPGEHRIKALKKLVKNGGRMMAAHFMGTGKTAFAIMAAQAMRNLTDENGKPHPNQLKGKTLIVVPLNTAENWCQEYQKFAGGLPTLIGARTLAGAQQLPKLPKRDEKETDEAFAGRVMSNWATAVKENPQLWNPFADDSNNVVIPFEYFRDNEEALRITKLFDGMVVDEAHKIARPNELSRAVERWNSKMRMFLPMTGTPITNTLETLPRIMRLVSGGAIDIDDETFKSAYLVPSAVARAQGAKNPPRTDLNPNKVGELMAMLQPYIDVANTTDVKGANMPAVLLDENTPAHMVGQQATMYRAAMADMTDADRANLESTGALGLDEEKLLSEDARRAVNTARSIANCPAYKAPDEREELQYMADIAQVDKKRGVTKVTTEKRAFRLPDIKQLLSDGPDGWTPKAPKKSAAKRVPKWPDQEAVNAGRIQAGYLEALMKNSYQLFGVDYMSLAGQPVDEKIIAGVKKQDFKTSTGIDWSGKIVNPDYGPEGMISRGVLNERTGAIEPLKYRWTDEHGNDHEDEIPTGLRFVRDPNRKASGLFYADADWDSTGRFVDSGEGMGGAGGRVQQLREEGWVDHPTDKGLIYNPELGESQEKPAGWNKKAGNQAPKPGHEGFDIQTSPARRRERAQFDAIVANNNAKSDAMEEWVKNVLSKNAGSPQGDLTQFILFGNRIGSSVRTMEAKLRTMGFQDVNEALGNEAVSTDSDKAKHASKYFVTYMGKGATLGDRNLNSEIFRRKQDEFGKDTGTSMFVFRTLYGNTKKPPALGAIKEGWSADERKAIAENFQSAQLGKKGEHIGLEIPMRVMGADDGKGGVESVYVYESDLKPKERAEVKRLEVLARGSSGETRKGHEAAMRKIFEPYWTNRKPLTDHQIHVFNNTQFMVASDAANVGLNWPAAYLGMYDSLFSPMDEWQRITRAARMLPPATSEKAAPIVAKIDKWIQENEAAEKRSVADYDERTAIGVLQEAIASLDETDQRSLSSMKEGAPEMLIEAYFAKRSLERIQGLREEAQAKLRKEGYWPDPEKRDLLQRQISDAQAAGDDGAARRLTVQLRGLFVPPEAIQSSDVTNYILREKLSPFERKMMKDRRFLVDVKRFTTSVDMPEKQLVVMVDPVTGKKKKIKVATGNFVVESPSNAERSQLAGQRVKMVPYERTLNDIQNARPQTTAYDFVESSVGSLSTTSTTDKTNTELETPTDDTLAYAEELRGKWKPENLVVPAKKFGWRTVGNGLRVQYTQADGSNIVEGWVLPRGGGDQTFFRTRPGEPVADAAERALADRLQAMASASSAAEVAKSMRPRFVISRAARLLG